MKNTGIVNLIAAETVTFNPPDSQAYGWVVLYNASSVSCMVNWGQNLDFIQANTAVAYKLPQPDTPLAVSVVSALQDEIMGTMSATWYLMQDGTPIGYPVGLPPFPGGSQLLANRVTLQGWSGTYYKPTNLTVRVPAGTQTITITNNGTASLGTIFVEGVQSSTVWYSNNNLQPNQSATFKINWVNEIVDTDLEIFLFPAGQGLITVYANAGGGLIVPNANQQGIPYEIPSAPNINAGLGGTGDHPPNELQLAFINTTSIPTSGVPILNAPGGGTRYRIFHVKLWQFDGGTNGLYITPTGGGFLIAFTGYTASSPALPPSDSNTIPLTGFPWPNNTGVSLASIANASSGMANIFYTTETV